MAETIGTFPVSYPVSFTNNDIVVPDSVGFLVIREGNDTIRIFHPKGILLGSLKVGSFTAFALSLDGIYLAMALEYGRVELYQITPDYTFLELGRIPKLEDNFVINRLEFSANGQLLAAAYSNGRINILDFHDKRLTSIVGHYADSHWAICNLQFSLNCQYLISKTAEKISVWRVRDGNLVMSKWLCWACRVSISPDGQKLAILYLKSGTNSVSIIDIESKRELQREKGIIIYFSFLSNGQYAVIKHDLTDRGYYFTMDLELEGETNKKYLSLFHCGQFYCSPISKKIVAIEGHRAGGTPIIKVIQISGLGGLTKSARKRS